MTYYKIKTGRIVSDCDMNLAYEIVRGKNAIQDYHNFKKWLKLTAAEIMDDSMITVQDFLDGGNVAGAVRKYRNEHKCTLREAHDAISAIRFEGKKKEVD